MALGNCRNFARPLALSAAILVVAGCASLPQRTFSEEQRFAIEDNMRHDIAILASEEFGGRKPGTDGEAKTLDFIESSLRLSGFESGTNDPANPWRAPVLLVSTSATASRVSIQSGKRTVVLPDDGAFAATSALLGLIQDSAMIFVGRLGETVPADMVLGKVVIMLGEPGKSPPRRDALFKKGASAVITTIEDEATIAQIRAARSRDSLQLASEVTDSLSVFATVETIKSALGDTLWDELSSAADDDDFAPIELDAKASVEARSSRREVTSYNLIGRLPGAVPDSGAVFMMAHWDHLGECGKETDEDRLCNGAVDNASGVAMVLELARRLAASGPHDRDIYVMGTTAEEWGLLGAKAFVKSPSVRLDSIVASLNYDTVAVAPRGGLVTFVGEGETPLDPIVLETAGQMKRTVGNRIMAQQFLRRQDSWALLEAGVPSIVLSTNLGSEDELNHYLSQHYHQASDDIDDIEMGGAVDDVELHQQLLQKLASTVDYPAGGE